MDGEKFYFLIKDLSFAGNTWSRLNLFLGPKFFRLVRLIRDFWIRSLNKILFLFLLDDRIKFNFFFFFFIDDTKRRNFTRVFDGTKFFNNCRRDNRSRKLGLISRGWSGANFFIPSKGFFTSKKFNQTDQFLREDFSSCRKNSFREIKKNYPLKIKQTIIIFEIFEKLKSGIFEIRLEFPRDSRWDTREKYIFALRISSDEGKKGGTTHFLNPEDPL